MAGLAYNLFNLLVSFSKTSFSRQGKEAFQAAISVQL